MAVKTRIDGDLAYIKVPYNRDFLQQIHHYGSAKWCPGTKEWQVPADQLGEIKQILFDIYGKDGDSEVPTVTLKITVKSELGVTQYQLNDAEKIGRTSFWEIGDKTVAKVKGPHDGVWLADGVTVKGKFYSDGKPSKPYMNFDKDTQIIVKGVSAPLAKKYKSGKSRSFFIKVEIVNEKALSRETLMAERKRLVARIAQIDDHLQEAGR